MPCAAKAAPAAVVLELAEPVRACLRRLAPSVTAQVRQALRGKIVLAAAGGLANFAIAREPKVSVETVRRWRGRFVAGGLAALRDAKRLGGPRTYESQVRVRVVVAATGEPPNLSRPGPIAGSPRRWRGRPPPSRRPGSANPGGCGPQTAPGAGLTHPPGPADTPAASCGICGAYLNPPGGAATTWAPKRCSQLRRSAPDKVSGACADRPINAGASLPRASRTTRIDGIRHPATSRPAGEQAFRGSCDPVPEQGNPHTRCGKGTRSEAAAGRRGDASVCSVRHAVGSRRSYGG
ncbi:MULTISPECIES: transposase [unclassified Streptomyces]|uniref:helix-turn-helix domain-containing protein n=1 Tax=unclassified Streptomyces TaxID=2593676 RepID=UPI0036ED6E22